MHRQITTLCSLIGLIPALISTNLAAEEITKWEFDKDTSGWVANDQLELSAKDGSLHLKSKGSDPYFSSKVKGQAGDQLLMINARFRGNADIQVFWTTEAEPQLTEDKSVKTQLRGSEKDTRSAKLYFATTSPVTSLRIDPMSAEGEMIIESIVLTDDSAPQPMATPVKDMKIAEGFDVELLYSVAGDKMGSWVCMTPDPKGRLIVSDQYGKLYRVTPPAKGSKDEIRIETINVDVGMAQGLLCAFDSLYVMTNSGEEARVGLHRVRDTDGDDQYDTA
jgi:hypothetical protein